MIWRRERRKGGGEREEKGEGWEKEKEETSHSSRVSLTVRRDCRATSKLSEFNSSCVYFWLILGRINVSWNGNYFGREKEKWTFSRTSWMFSSLCSWFSGQTAIEIGSGMKKISYFYLIYIKIKALKCNKYLSYRLTCVGTNSSIAYLNNNFHIFPRHYHKKKIIRQ